jgi:SAM-dependent methyltransferase
MSAAAARPAAGGALAARLPSLIEAWRGEGRPSLGGRLTRPEIESAGSALLSLQRGLTGERRLAGQRYMDSSELLGAYLLYYWPVSYLQFSLALAELDQSSRGAPRRVLDLGSGPGPASAALLDSLMEKGVGPPEELVLVDASRDALDLASSLLARGRARPARISTFELDLEAGFELPSASFDFIVMGHSLNELWRGRDDAVERRTDLVKRAARLLAPGGLILLVEPALLVTCRELIALRDRLAADGWSVLGPCPGSFPCPAFAAGPERSCHAESPWTPPEPIASLAAAAGLDRSSVKWTHFFLRPEGSQAEGSGIEALPRACPASRRVVSDPMLNKAGRLRYILCGGGALTTLSARADDEAALDLGFAGLRRGDMILAEKLEDRAGGGFGIGSGSSLEFLSLAPEAAR